MMEKVNPVEIQSLAGFPSARAQDRVPVKTSLIWRTWRFSIYLVGILAIILVLFSGILFATLKGSGISNEQIRLQVEDRLSLLVGPLHNARIAEINFSIGTQGLLAIIARELTVVQSETGNEALTVSAVKIGISPWALLSGRVEVERVLMANAHIAIPPKVTKTRFKWPKSINVSALLDLAGVKLSKLAGRIEKSGLASVRIRNVQITGLRRFKLSSDSATIARLLLTSNGNGNIKINSQVKVRQASWKIAGGWISNQDADNGMTLDITGVEAGDLLPGAKAEKRGAIGLDAPLALRFIAPFSDKQVPLDATLSIAIGAGDLRFGREVLTKITSGQMHFRLLAAKNQIEIEPSEFVFGESRGTIIGGLRFPKQDSGGLPLFEVIANDIVANVPQANEEPMVGNVLVRGTIDTAARTLKMEEITLSTPEGRMIGAGSVGFTGETPSLALALNMPGISARVLKQFWPVFIAPAARKWVHENLISGRVTSASLDAAIPPGILGRTRLGRVIKPNQLRIEARVEDAYFTTTGEFPTVQKAKGVFTYRGMESHVSLESGFVEMEDGGKINLNSAEMDIGSYQLSPIPAKLKLNVTGSVRALAYMGMRKPLAITPALKITPDQVSGSMSGELEISFPLKKKNSIDDFEWRAVIDTKGAGSTKPIGGRLFSRADLRVIARPGVAEISGKAEINGVLADISLTQPFGKGAIKNPTGQKLKLVLDAAARKKLGIDLKPIVEGRMDVSMESTDEGKSQKVVADLTRAKLSLPWIGWSKGKGIKAEATFSMTTNKGIINISDFVLSGAGFTIAGDIVVDKKGMRSARLRKVRLNRGDRLSVKIDRAKIGYSIKANGSAYDARAIVRQVMSKGSLSGASSKKLGFEVLANLDEVVGFGGEIIKNVKIRFSQRKGTLSSLSIVGRAANNAKMVISISPQKGKTLTEAYSANAGATLRFLDVYSKIRGGKLSAKITQKGKNPHRGAVSIKDFNLVNEPRVKSLLSAPISASDLTRSGELKKIRKIRPNDVPVSIIYTQIIKGENYMKLKKGFMRGGDVGASFEGVLFNAKGQMDLNGTFLPAFGLNNALSKIPLLGQVLGGGTKSGLIGITYRLAGNAKSPKIFVNPMSIMAPGIFRQLFEYN